MKKLYFLIFLCFISLLTMAQKKCGSDEYYNYQIASNPEFAKNQDLLEQATKKYIKTGAFRAKSIGSPIYTIPVVVHVLYCPDQKTVNISDYQIINQIKLLNMDFQTKYDKCPIYFRDLQADCQIEFILAKRDPNGICTNGIIRKTTDKLTFTMGGIDGGISVDKDDAKFSSKKGDDAWDPSSYLNIWLVPQLKKGNGEILSGGYAQWPGGNPETDGVVINSFDFLGISRTPTHEIGHWLNLKHIWGYCIGGDGVDDTPNQFGPHVNERPEGIQKSCPGEPFGDMYMNYMDYTDDEYMNMFTDGQKKRMHAAIANDLLRSTVVRSGNYALIPPKAELSIINQDAPTSVVAGYPITVNFAEYNTGSLSAPPNYVNIHLSSKKVFTPGSTWDRYLDQYFIEQGVPSRSQTMEFSKEITIPSDVTPGDYYLFFAADGTRVVTECDANNDTASVKITVKASTALNPPRNLIAVASNEQVTLTWLAPTSGSPSSYNIYRNTAENGKYALIDVSKTTTNTISGLSNGTTYWFYIESIYTSGTAISNIVSAIPAATSTKPKNDDCSNAISLTSSNSCYYLENQTVNNATASGKPKGLCDNYTGTPDLADVWYYFKAQSTSHTITVDPNGSQLDAVIVAYSSCTSNTGINCSDVTGGPGTLSTLNLTGLVIGNYYYIRVYDYGKQTTMGDFRICVTGQSSSNMCAITSITPNTKTHGSASFSTTPGLDNINFVAQPNCTFEITNYCSWLSVSPMSGTTNSSGQASVNYTIEANNTTTTKECIFYINGSPVTITQNGINATDDDNDGVINSLDLCPNTPSSEVVDANGCSDSQIFLDVKNLQYNDVVLNTPQNRTISFTNEGSTDFTITGINITGTNANLFSIAPIPPIVVSSGNYQNLTVTFNPTSIGAKAANIVITTNTAKIPTKTITLNGNGVDHLTNVLVCNPATSYNFGDTKKTESNSKSFIIQNTGSNKLTISNLAIEGLNPEPYSITYTRAVPFDIGSGSTEIVTVKFSPTSVGSKSATLAITNNSDNLSPKYSIGLSGNGTENYYIGSINNLIALEYWFDNDYHTKVNTPVTALFNSYSGAQIPTDGLATGLHSINIRYQDIKENWSSVVSGFFHRLPVTTADSPKITASEYWFDDNYSTKVSGALVPDQKISVNSGFEVSSLVSGLHSYHVRYKDDAGQWSSIISEFFQKIPVATSGTRNITTTEYWIDEDYANKVSTDVRPGQTISVNGGFNVEFLSTGLHSYYVRFKDDAGQWSSVISEFFHKLPTTTTGTRKITNWEYWFDGNYSTKVSAAVTPDQLISVNSGFEVGSLSSGLHSYHVRYKDDAGQWSSIVSEFFQKIPVATSGTRNITASEYWIDEDYANKVSTAVTPGQTITVNGGFVADSLSAGLHSYHVRYKDDAGQWSSVISEFFHKLPATTTGTRKITNWEYWFDDNFRSKVSAAVSPDQLISVNSDFEVGSLSSGLHSYHVRYKDDAGQWSAIVSEFFQKIPMATSGTRNISASEYWIDEDYTNKVTSSITPGQTVLVNGSFVADSLSTGIHSYHVRYKDDAGQWSSVVSKFFHKMPTTSTGIRKITNWEYWFDDDYSTKVTNAISPDQLISVNSGFEVGSLTNGLHSYHVRYKDNAGQWSSIVSELFQKLNTTGGQANVITAYRYWFDRNEKDMITVNVENTQNPYLLIKNLNTCNLTLGNHTVHLQFKDLRLGWSSATNNSLTKSASTIPEITFVGSTSFCQGDSITLIAPTSESYLWSNGATTSTIKVTESGNYSVQVNLDSSCSLSSKAVSVIVNPFPNAADGIIGATTVTNNQKNVIYTVSPILNANTYDWTLPNGATGTSNTNTISVSFDNATLGTIGEIKVKGRNNCGDGPESVLAISINNINWLLNLASIEEVKVYPNPVTDGFYVSGFDGIALLKLTDINGRLLLTSNITNDEFISIKMLSKSVYIAKIITSGGISERKLVKK